jgi:hypothetical protein
MTGAPSGATQTNPTTAAPTYLASVTQGYPLLTAPEGLAIDAAGKLYVADNQSNTVDVYTASSGVYLNDVVPSITLIATPTGDTGTNLTWTSVGILPANATCTLTTGDGAYTNTPVSDQNPSGVTLNYNYGSATLSCPGAVAVNYEDYGS